MLSFGAITYPTSRFSEHSKPSYSIFRRPTPHSGRPIEIFDNKSPETPIAIVRQADGARTEVNFFEGKGGIAAIVTTNNLRYLALPGSYIELPDTIVDMPGERIEGTSAVAVPAHACECDGHCGHTQTVTNQAMILGAGLATRFEPVSGDMTGFSKPAVPLVGEDSVIVALARHLNAHGIDHIIVNTYYKPEAIKQQLTSALPQVKFTFIDEEKPSGTAGGLAKALERGAVDPNKPILVMQGDTVTDADLSHLLNAHQKHGAKVTLGVQPVTDADLDKVAILKTDRSGHDGDSGKILSYIEKPGRDPKLVKKVGDSRMGSTGFYVLSPEVFPKFQAEAKKSWKRGPEYIYDYAMNFFPSLLRMRKNRPLMWAEKVSGYWNDIGNFKQYIGTVKDIFAGKVKLRMPTDISRYLENGVIYWQDTHAKAKALGAQLSGNIIVANKPNI